MNIVELSDKTFGGYLKELRLKRHLTLREFCLRNRLDAGNQSKLERGKLSPPETAELLDFYCKALKATKAEREGLVYLCRNYHLSKINEEFP